MDDPYDLERFVTAQDRDGVYEQAVSELRAGLKQTGWMWFVFPQLRGLGYTETALRYGISSGAEASAYLDHEVLGPRLRRCARVVARSGSVTASTLMAGDVNAKKLKSSMTLFAAVAEDNEDFVAVLRKYYHGGRDLKTLEMLREEQASKDPEAPAPPPAKRRRWLRRRHGHR